MAAPIITPEAAAALIKDGDTVFVGGNGGTGVAEAILTATEELYLDRGRPRDLTLMHVTGVGALTHGGVNHFAHKGMVKRVIGGNYGLQLPFMKELIVTNEVEAYNFPQGVMSQLCRAMAAKQPGVITHVGLGTYMDPRQEGGKMNAAATEDLIEVVELAGREWLFYRAPTPDIAFIRGTTADDDCYVTMEHEGTTREDLSIAQAVHNAGGIVVCQVKRLARRGSLHPLMVQVPGFLIDHVVHDPEQWQTFGTQYDPAVTGEERADLASIEPDPLDIRHVIARRAAMELRPGEVINLGVGVSTGIPNIAAEEGIEDMVTLTVIRIEREGRIGKFVPEVGQISYNARMGQDRGQSVTFVTDRAVLRIARDGLMLTELFPGARLREDVLDHIGFEVDVSPDLKPVDDRIFRAGPMGLRDQMSSRR